MEHRFGQLHPTADPPSLIPQYICSCVCVWGGGWGGCLRLEVKPYREIVFLCINVHIHLSAQSVHSREGIFINQWVEEMTV